MNRVSPLVATIIFLVIPLAAAETGSLPAYNVRTQNLLQVPPCPPALGDGLTDDTAAIQCALTAAGADGGGTVFMPPGEYRTSTPLSVPSNVILAGAGVGTIVKPLSGATIITGVILLSNSVAPVMFATVRDLRIVGNGENLTTLYAGVALDFGASHNTVASVIVENVRAEGIGLYSSSEMLSNDYNVIQSCTIRDNGVGTTDGQVIVASGRYNEIINNLIYRAGGPRTGLAWGILFNVYGPQWSVQHNIVRGNRVINTGYAGVWMRISQCSGCTDQVAWNEISGNELKDNQNWGVLLDFGAGHSIVSGNTVTGNGMDGIKIQSGGNTVSHNVVSDNGQLSPHFVGIRLVGFGATDNSIIGNASQNVTTAAQRRGIQEDAGGPNFNVMTGNNVRGNSLTPGIIVTGASTIAANNIGQ